MNKTFDQIFKINCADNIIPQLEEINDFAKQSFGKIIKIEPIPNSKYLLVVVRIKTND